MKPIEVPLTIGHFKKIKDANELIIQIAKDHFKQEDITNAFHILKVGEQCYTHDHLEDNVFEMIKDSINDNMDENEEILNVRFYPIENPYKREPVF